MSVQRLPNSAARAVELKANWQWFYSRPFLLQRRQHRKRRQTQIENQEAERNSGTEIRILSSRIVR